MSWSDFAFDPYTPVAQARLTVNRLLFSKDYRYNSGEQTSCNHALSPCEDWPRLCTEPAGSRPGRFCALPRALHEMKLCGNRPDESLASITLRAVASSPCIGEGRWRRFETCYYEMDQRCVVIDGLRMATLGTDGKGTCRGDCRRDTDWNFSEVGAEGATSDKGWIYLQYRFDYSSYDWTGPSLLSRWINAVYSGTNESIPNGLPINMKYYLRDSNLIYALLLDFYNQIYNTGPYEAGVTESIFMHSTNPVRFLTRSSFERFRDTNIIQPLVSPLTNVAYAPANKIPDALNRVILELLDLPKVVIEGDNYFLDVNLTYTQYQRYLSEMNKKGYITKLVHSLLRDDRGRLGTDNLRIPDPVRLGEPEFKSISVVSLDLTNQSNYSIILVSSPNNYPQQHPNCIFALARYRVRIERWSPMMVVYTVATTPGLNFSANTCALIASQGLLPHSCFIRASDPTSRRNNIAAYCAVNYDGPNYISRAFVDEILLTQRNNICNCYVSDLVPLGLPQTNNKAAMCFDMNCDREMRDLFQLDDEFCQSYCPDMTSWLNNPQIVQRPRDTRHLNTDRYSRLCGRNYAPYVGEKVNKSVAITGSVAVVLATIIAFLVARYFSLGTGGTIGLTAGIFALFIAGVVFMSLDFAGEPRCEDGEMVCRSRFTKTKLPESYCSYSVNCECAFDNECPGGCICASGICLPPNGQRPVREVRYRKLNVISLIMSLIVAVVMPIIMISLYHKLKIPIGFTVFTVLSVLVGVTPLVYTLATDLQWKTRPEYVGSCRPLEAACTSRTQCAEGQNCYNNNCCTPTCVEGRCGERMDGCGGYCGCPPDQKCENGQCVPCISNCAGKICGDDGCGQSCGLCPVGRKCENGQCVACTRNCTNKMCGDDGCGDANGCGTCPPGSRCNNGQCELCPTGDCSSGACNVNNCAPPKFCFREQCILDCPVPWQGVNCTILAGCENGAVSAPAPVANRHYTGNHIISTRLNNATVYLSLGVNIHNSLQEVALTTFPTSWTYDQDKKLIYRRGYFLNALPYDRVNRKYLTSSCPNPQTATQQGLVWPVADVYNPNMPMNWTIIAAETNTNRVLIYSSNARRYLGVLSGFVTLVSSPYVWDLS